MTAQEIERFFYALKTLFPPGKKVLVVDHLLIIADLISGFFMRFKVNEIEPNVKVSLFIKNNYLLWYFI